MSATLELRAGAALGSLSQMAAEKPQTLSERLRAWRKAKDLGRKAAALELGVSKRTLQDWEQGRRPNPYYATIAPVIERLERDGF